jgi:hypothetical protein
MKSSGWESIIQLWQNVFYTIFFTLFCIVIALVSAIRFSQKEKLSYLFLIYIISAGLLFTSCELIGLAILDLRGRRVSIFFETANLCFAFIEYIVFYNFFLSILKSKITKKIMGLFSIFFAIVIILFISKEFDYTFSRSEIYHYSDMVVSSELLFLGILCIVYYSELLKAKPVTNLPQSPSFWIVSGLFFYCLLITPFFMISENLHNEYKQVYNVFYAAHYISFGLLFLALTKAFLCKRPLTT